MDFYWARTVGSEGGPNMAYPPNAISRTIYAGVPIVLAMYAGAGSSTVPVARELVADDIADLYTENSTYGIFGFAKHGAVTNSTGAASSQQVYSGKSAMAEPITNAPSIGYTLSPMYDSTDTLYFSRLPVWLALPGQLFWANPYTGVTPGPAYRNKLAGIDLTAGVYTVNPEATTKILKIVGYDSNSYDLPGNTPKRFLVEVLPAYCQSLVGSYYTDES